MKSLKRIRKRTGRCYELACKVMLEEPDAERFTLIHGRTGFCEGDPYPTRHHAWIDMNNGQIYDPVIDRYMTMDDYVALHGVVEIDDRYTKDEAVRMMLDTKHYGRWRDVVWHPDTEEYRQWLTETTEKLKKRDSL
jgi:hypothetical protein